MIRKGDKVTRLSDGKTGTAIADQYTAYSGWDAVLVRWDNSSRPAVPNRVSKLRRTS